MIYSILFFVCISIGSFISRKVSFVCLIFLLPFYTILREMLGFGLISFIWPYIWIAVLILLATFKSSDTSSKKFFFILNLILLFACFALIASKGPSNFTIISISDIFNNFECLFLISVSLLNFLAFINIAFNKIKISENKVSYLDFSILFFILYGFLQIYISFVEDRDLFNSIFGFRYYFSGSIIYFLARVLIDSKRDVFVVVITVLLSILIASIFIYFEGILLNVMDINPKLFPWNNGVLGQVFDYGPDVRTFIDTVTVPNGVMFMLHLSGVLNLFGFALVFPFIYFLDKFEDNTFKSILIIFVILSPLSFIFASKTTVVLYYVSIFTTALFLIKFWKKSFVIVPIFAILIPFTYSYYLLPGMTQDYGRVISYLISPQTATLESLNSNEPSLSKNTKSIFYGASKDDRVLNNSVYELLMSAKEDFYINSELENFSFSKRNVFFGAGYQISQWNKLNARKNLSKKDFQLNTKSDTPYINFVFQFGLVGIIFLFSVIIFSLVYPLLSFKNSKKYVFTALSVGIFAVMITQAIGLLHLQILFKTGLNTSIFILMAISLKIYSWKDI